MPLAGKQKKKQAAFWVINSKPYIAELWACFVRFFSCSHIRITRLSPLHQNLPYSKHSYVVLQLLWLVDQCQLRRNIGKIRDTGATTARRCCCVLFFACHRYIDSRKCFLCMFSIIDSTQCNRASYSFVTNNPPSGGSCGLQGDRTDNDGYEIRCEGFVDDDEPLEYQFVRNPDSSTAKVTCIWMVGPCSAWVHIPYHFRWSALQEFIQY